MTSLFLIAPDATGISITYFFSKNWFEIMLMSSMKANQSPEAPCAQKVKTAVLPLALIGLTILKTFSGNSVLITVGIVAGVLIFFQSYLNDKRNLNKAKKTFLAMIGMLVAIFFNVLTQPAQAQFFQKAQTFFTAQFTSSGQAIPIVFNTLRALYIIYLAIAFIGVFNSVRQDEDWITAARTPIIVVICVTLADLLTGLITGT